MASPALRPRAPARSTRPAGLIALIPLVWASACVRPTIAGDAAATRAVSWREPGTDRDVRTLPTGPFDFLEEDLSGDSPKFSVRDARGLEWQVKLGPEARAETAATRILAAAGYFVEETHYLPSVRVRGVSRLKRGRQFVRADDEIAGARFEARPAAVTRGPTWDWASNPFVGTQALDGLRVLMVLINNYDARTANNRVLLTRDAAGIVEARYVVTDLGASFGQYGGLGGTRTKSDLLGYRASAFIERVRDGRVHFAYRTRPEGWGVALFVLDPLYTRGELKKQRDLGSVPLASARWIGQRLAAFPDPTWDGAFEAAGYDAADVSAFAEVLRARIAALNAL